MESSTYMFVPYLPHPLLQGTISPWRNLIPPTHFPSCSLDGDVLPFSPRNKSRLASVKIRIWFHRPQWLAQRGACYPIRAHMIRGDGFGFWKWEYPFSFTKTTRRNLSLSLGQHKMDPWGLEILASMRGELELAGCHIVGSEERANPRTAEQRWRNWNPSDIA